MLRSSSSSYQWVSLILMVLAAASAAGAVVVGVEDNLPGLALAVLAGLMLVTAFVHGWRSPKRFLSLSAVSFGLCVIAVGILIAVDISLTEGQVPMAVAPVVDAGGNTLALMVAFLVVPSILVGLAGSLITWLTGRRDRAKFERAMGRVRDVEPDEGDE